MIGSSQNGSLKAEKWKSVEKLFDKSPVDTSYMGWIWGELLLPFRQLEWDGAGAGEGVEGANGGKVNSSITTFLTPFRGRWNCSSHIPTWFDSILHPPWQDGAKKTARFDTDGQWQRESAKASKLFSVFWEYF